MKLQRRQFLHLAAGIAALPSLSRIVQAQTYPSRPITIIVPFPAGGPTDTIARLLAERMRESLEQTIVVENVSGANGTIGVGRAAHSAPDGYTVSIGHWSTHVLNGAIYPLQYDLRKDFEPVAMVATSPQLIVTKNDVPAKNLPELIAWLKANPDKAMAATSGPGSPSHIAGVFFQKQTGTSFRFVPYRGSAPMMQDLLGGRVDLIFDQAADALPHVRSHKIRAYAVTAASRLKSEASIPTVDEEGLHGFYVSVWHGLWVPRDTPQAIVTTLNTAAVQALADPNVRARFSSLGQEIPSPDQHTPEALGILQKAEMEKWWPIIKAANIKIE